MIISKSRTNTSIFTFLKPKLVRATAYLLIGSMFWTITAWQVPAQKDLASDPKNAERLFDAYTTVMTMAYPPAGGALKIAKEMLSALGFFKSPDVVGEAMKKINERLDAIEARIDKLQNEIVSTRNEGRENANLENVRALRGLRENLEDILIKLGRKPTEQFEKDDLARQAERVANTLYEDVKLWEWSDQAIKDHNWEGKAVKAGTFLDRDFKPMPTLEIYEMALAIWMATIENASGGNKAVIANSYGNALQRHSNFLQVSPDWDERSSVPKTLPEKIKSRIRATYVPLSNLPDSASQICSIAEYLTDDMARQFARVGQIDYVARSRFEGCNVPSALANLEITRRKDGVLKKSAYISSPREEELEDAYGADSMALLVQKIEQLKRTGTLREQFIGTFNTTVSGDETKILYTVSEDGTLTWHQHIMRYPKGSSSPVHTFSAPKTVGTGWASGVRDVLPVGQIGIYAVRENGTLTWNWHLGFADGSTRWGTQRDIAKGLSGFTQIIAQDQGVLYAHIQGDPGIFWGMTSNYDGKKGPPIANIALRLTSETINFAAFKTMFGGGEGVLYAIGYDGHLYWMRHLMYQSPIPDPGVRIPNNPQYMQWRQQWIGPVDLGSGFQGVTQIFSPGEGHIYYVRGDSLVWRRHTGWQKGTNTWNGPNWEVAASGWGGYKFTFARNTTSDLNSGNPNLEIVVH